MGSVSSCGKSSVWYSRWRIWPWPPPPPSLAAEWSICRPVTSAPSPISAPGSRTTWPSSSPTRYFPAVLPLRVSPVSRIGRTGPAGTAMDEVAGGDCVTASDLHGTDRDCGYQLGGLLLFSVSGRGGRAVCSPVFISSLPRSLCSLRNTARFWRRRPLRPLPQSRLRTALCAPRMS
jgi:hypothetical protein